MELKKDIFEGITAEPREHYTVQIDPASVAPVKKKYIGKLIKRMIIGILCGVILLFFGFSSVFYLGMGLGIVLLVSASHITVISNTKKQYAKAEAKYPCTVYDYTLYDEFLIVCLSSDTGIIQTKYRLQELVRVEIVGSLVTLELDGPLFFINRDALPENSYFLSRCL